MKRKIILALILSASFSTYLSSNELDRKCSTYYLKIGPLLPPGDGDGLLPTIGAGARFQRNNFGFDLSANAGTLIFVNYLSLKGIVLYYPFPERHHQLYMGLGPGIGYQADSVPIGGSFGASSTECALLNCEGVVGFEFRHSAHLKSFIQLELTQPFYISCPQSHYKPGVALSVGAGF